MSENEESKVKQQRDLLIDATMRLCELIPEGGNIGRTADLHAMLDARTRLVALIKQIKKDRR